MPLNPILLAGGQSTRMGTRKELLCLTRIPIYEQQLRRLHQACPDADAVFLSLPTPDALPQILDNPHAEHLDRESLRLHDQSGSFLVRVLYDHQGAADQGPAGGLLAAHRHDPAADWLIVACDYPLLSVAAMRQLCGEMSGPVTCFENEDGIIEPLVGIWSPAALESLEDNVKNGILGPKAVVLRTKGKTLRPYSEIWLFNMNTPDDFEHALRMSRDTASLTGEF